MTSISNQKIVLASASPRRLELAEQMGFAPLVVKSRVEEVITETDPSKVVQELSLQKARDVALHLVEYLIQDGIDEMRMTENEGVEGLAPFDLSKAVILGADTVVAIDGEILGKPKTHQEAFDMISRLQGKVHQVYTGVTLLRKREDAKQNLMVPASESRLEDEWEVRTFFEETNVYVTPMTEDEIMAYAKSEEPMDKAGAYGIQGTFGRFISRIEGDYYNVVGLPMARTYQEVKELLG